LSNTAINKWNEKVHPHGGIIKLDDRLWYVTGSLPHGNVPRNMVIYRLNSGGLLIHSAVALKDEYMKEIEALGSLDYMIVPNKYHRLDAPLFKQRYEGIKVLCPSSIRSNVEKKVEVDNTVEDEAEGIGIKYHIPNGFRPGDLVYELDITNGKVLVFCDLLFNMENFGGLDGWLLRLLGSTGFFGSSWIARLQMKDKGAVKSLLLKLSEIPDLRMVVLSHGKPISENCNEKLKEAASLL
jgi:hypothetical protein